MKRISKEDLTLLVQLIGDRDDYGEDDFELLLNRFGDDYFVYDGVFQKVGENNEMTNVRGARLVACGSCGNKYVDLFEYCPYCGTKTVGAGDNG